MSDPGAGPSSTRASSSAMDGAAAPVFKKRNRAKGQAGRIRIEEIDASGGKRNLDGGEDGEESSKLADTERSAAAEDEEQATSVQDLLALRALTKRPVAGIDLQKLNEGERKRKKKKAASSTGPKTSDELWAEQMQKGGLVPNPSASGKKGDDSDEEDGTEKKRRLLKHGNFQGETGTVDVDKHMMAYIEAEMAKRRAEAAAANRALSSSDEKVDEGAVRRAILNPEDELYKIAEQYKELQKKPLITEKEEGNVTLSAAMLSSIPEVDLGVESKLKNIEETERAKRMFYEQKQRDRMARAGDGDGGEQRQADEAYASARFMRSGKLLDSDAVALRNARLEAAGEPIPPPRPERSDRKELSSDQQVMDRFKKRQANQRR